MPPPQYPPWGAPTRATYPPRAPPKAIPLWPALCAHRGAPSKIALNAAMNIQRRMHTLLLETREQERPNLSKDRHIILPIPHICLVSAHSASKPHRYSPTVTMI